jgi:high-affinity nickel-transport protein
MRERRGVTPLKARLVALYTILVVANVAAWVWAFVLFSGDSVKLGTALLAYSLGLRHAVDADHIAAIDNVTRKLIQDGKRPLTVGFFFALGHSTIVLIAAGLIAFTVGALARFQSFSQIGGVIATATSATFLFVIATMNLLILRTVWQRFEIVRKGGRYSADDLDILLGGRGPLSRLFRPLFALIRHSWQMAPLGFLFGLGFDTATEVTLLGLAGAQAAHGLSIGAILVFPALFAAGMALIDTTDGVLMPGCVRMGIRKAHPKTLLQHDNYGRLRARRNSHRRHRNHRIDSPQTGADKRRLEVSQQSCRAFQCARLRNHRVVRRCLGCVVFHLPVEAVR